MVWHESHGVLAASSSAESGDDRIREVKATAVSGERSPYNGVLVHAEFPCVQQAFHQFGAGTSIHLVSAPQDLVHLDDGNQAEVARVGLR